MAFMRCTILQFQPPPLQASSLKWLSRTQTALTSVRSAKSKTGMGGPVGESPFLESLPPGTNSRVLTAEFVKSSPGVKECPPELYPEVAFVGRSNVGKSSLINSLTGKKNLASVSNTPGGDLRPGREIGCFGWDIVVLNVPQWRYNNISCLGREW